jgi:DNA-binding transcriptional ArsR family regulator
MADDRCDLLCLDLDKAEKLRGQRMAPAHLAQIARQAQAFGDPTRLDLAVSLQLAGELCVCDLAWISGRSQNLVSHHLRALKAAELADSRREGKVVFYRLTTVGDRFLSEALVATLREMVEEVEVL